MTMTIGPVWLTVLDNHDLWGTNLELNYAQKKNIEEC